MIETNLALFLGRRRIAENIKNWLYNSGNRPVIVIYDDHRINEGDIEKMQRYDIDYIFCVQYHNILPEDIMRIPKLGCVNTHPAYLPYNRGWHTPTWAILDGTPYGATMHYMTEEIDAGDIIYQEKLPIAPEDTAHTLYQKVLALEEDVFKKGFNSLLDGTATRTGQDHGESTTHKKNDIKKIQQIADIQITKLKALTTNKLNEAAYFEENGKRYAVQVKIEELK